MDNGIPHMKYNAAGQGVTLHCPGCAAALVYDPVSGKMLCESCGSTYTTAELEYENRYRVDEDDMMECNVYTCRSCGAELNVSDNTCSTFCAFCGQPTVVFDRVATMKKPQLIIPFEVTKEQAVAHLRVKVNDGKFVPKEVKEFSIDRVSGIYVPFWLFDMDYSDKQLLSGEVKSGKSTYTYYYYREGETNFSNMTLDASRQLNDESSRRLEPYTTQALRPFKADYLSGFYADRYDVDAYELQGSAVRRAAELFNREIELDVETTGAKKVKIIRHDPKFQINGAKYAMLPAWFLTFRYKDVPYTMLVNGQTGKIVGGLPYEKTPLILLFTLIFAIVAPIAAFIYNVVDLDDGKRLLGLMIAGSAIAFAKGVKNLKDVEKSRRLSSEADIANYSKNR